MTIISDVVGVAAGTATRPLLPWFILAAILALSSAGAAGMYGGYEIANARYAKDRQALQDAQIEALTASKEALKIAVTNSSQVAGEFMTALKGIQIVNTTITNEVRKETEKLVYTDCKLPDSGADLLKKNADAVNMRLLGKGKVK